MAGTHSGATVFKSPRVETIKIPFTYDEYNTEIEQWEKERDSNMLQKLSCDSLFRDIKPPKKNKAYVVVNDMAHSFNRDRSSFFKWLKKRNYHMDKIYLAEKQGQKTCVLSHAEAKRAFRQLLQEGYKYGGLQKNEVKP